MRSRRAAAIVVALLATVCVPAVRAAGGASCATGPVPYAGLGGALHKYGYTSKDTPPLHYAMWRGTTRGFDGMPFSVDVTVPCGPTSALPAIVMTHGFTDDKTVWEETGKGDRVVSRDRPEQDSHWNNIWFASRGYAVLTYTARGWHDSCGPDTPGATRATPSPRCLPYKYWIHLDDKRWEVRDAQWLAGGLVQSGVADPSRLAITGGSYGGGPPSMAAMLAGKTMCGASSVPGALGVDPCAGHANGELVPWTTPDGRTPLTWAVSVPMYTFADLIQVLAPNGRGSDGWELAPPDGDHTSPVGVPIESTIVGLLAAGATAGFYAPPGVDRDSDIITGTLRLLLGNPFPQRDPLVRHGLDVYRRFKSPITTPPQGRVPIFWVHGLTDPLFTGLEALEMLNHARASDPNYPIEVFLGDLGHDYTAQRQDEWDAAHVQMNAFVDHYLRPDRTPEAPIFDVTASITRCLDHDAPMRLVRAPSWPAIHPHHETFTSATSHIVNSVLIGSSARATDPITTATLPLPGSYHGCRIVRPSARDAMDATYDFALDHDVVLMGGPVVSIDYLATAPNRKLDVRVWDVDATASAEGLITRGTYRSSAPAGSTHTARFQLAPQGYRFPAGHRIRVEVAANDLPYYQATNLPAVVRIGGIELTLPTA